MYFDVYMNTQTMYCVTNGCIVSHGDVKEVNKIRCPCDDMLILSIAELVVVG